MEPQQGEGGRLPLDVGGLPVTLTPFVQLGLFYLNPPSRRNEKHTFTRDEGLVFRRLHTQSGSGRMQLCVLSVSSSHSCLITDELIDNRRLMTAPVLPDVKSYYFHI